MLALVRQLSTSGDSGADGPIEQLVDEGYAVVTVDLRGQGETSTGKRNALLTDWKTYYLAYLMGKPLLGMRVEDALAAADFVAYYEKETGRAVPDLRYYIVLYHFRLCVLLEGVYQRSFHDPTRQTAEQAGEVAMANARDAVYAMEAADPTRSES